VLCRLDEDLKHEFPRLGIDVLEQVLHHSGKGLTLDAPWKAHVPLAGVDLPGKKCRKGRASELLEIQRTLDISSNAEQELRKPGGKADEFTTADQARDIPMQGLVQPFNSLGEDKASLVTGKPDGGPHDILVDPNVGGVGADLEEQLNEGSAIWRIRSNAGEVPRRWPHGVDEPLRFRRAIEEPAFAKQRPPPRILKFVEEVRHTARVVWHQVPKGLGSRGRGLSVPKIGDSV
jgi:hypothetical protein